MTSHDHQPSIPDLDIDPATADARGLHRDEMAGALLAAADGSDPAVASVELLIDHGSWLDRDDFRRVVHVDHGFSDGRLMAFIDWDAVLAADLPASTGESQLLALAAELAGLSRPIT